MNKSFKVFSIIILMIFSFYYTEKIALYVQNNTPLKKEIITYKESNSIPYINAKVSGEYITPGLNGKEINVDKSYENMKLSNSFNENEIVYNEVTPSISLDDYPSKIINRGNLNKKGVSIIINNNSELELYLKDNNIRYTKINNIDFCIITNNECNNTLRKVKPSLIINNSNFLKNVNLITNGDIILIEDSIELKYINVMIKQLEYSNLRILDLKEHLSENNDI